MDQHEAAKPEIKSEAKSGVQRAGSFSQASENSQTAAEFIDSQLALEAEAREALPYAFDSCTRPLGSLRQIVFSCLTCNQPPSDPLAPYPAAGICYSCSIACHGEHELVEIFNKRNFLCDCGTTRFTSTNPCTLRLNADTGTKGGVHSEAASESNHYDQNYANRFCGCERVYDAHKQRGTMFQCLGLGYAEDGGCGEDWWHPGCLTGVGPDWVGAQKPVKSEPATGDDSDVEEPTPPGFPEEDDFEGFLCYKCVDANPWIRAYAGTRGFLAPVVRKGDTPQLKTEIKEEIKAEDPPTPTGLSSSLKRKAEDDPSEDTSAKKIKDGHGDSFPDSTSQAAYHIKLPSPPSEQFSLFFKEDFREHFCRCPTCFPRLSKFPQLLEEEDSYEPPRSETEDDGVGGSSVGTASLLDRGERALNNVDRVRAIEGVMAYNHLKEKVKTFLKPFAESGEAVGADDIKKYFEQLRGDAEAIKEANASAANGSREEDGEDGFKREQSGY